jgi:hypothetical protein
MLSTGYFVEREGIKASAFNSLLQPTKRPREIAVSGGMAQGADISMDIPSIASSCVETLTTVLHSVEIADLVEHIEFFRWTGRPGYSIRTMMGVVLTKSLYAIPTRTRTLALVREHPGMRRAIGCVEDEQVLQSTLFIDSRRN